MENRFPIPCPMTFAEARLKAKVVVEERKGIPSFWAASLPQNAMESATIPSGAIRSISRQIFSSRASVARTIRSMEKAKSLPTRALSSREGVIPNAASSQGTKVAPAS